MKDTNNDIKKAFVAAARDFDASLSTMRPYRNESEGYCEANLVEYYSHALRQLEFRPFREFPIPKGRVDALYYRDSTVLLLEAKLLYQNSVKSIADDLARLQSLNLSDLLRRYGFPANVTECFHIALCDCWSFTEQQQWTASPPHHSFLTGYTTRHHAFKHGHAKLPYAWLLAYTKNA